MTISRMEPVKSSENLLSVSTFASVDTPVEEGLGPAYVAGFRWALERDYERIIEMDADFSHQPPYLVDMLRTLETHDVAVGSRWVAGGGVENWGLHRRILSRGGSLYSRLILG